MESVFLFCLANSVLMLILLIRLKDKDRIDILFLGCLLFTFLGNMMCGLSINTILSFINLFLGMVILEK